MCIRDRLIGIVAALLLAVVGESVLWRKPESLSEESTESRPVVSSELVEVEDAQPSFSDNVKGLTCIGLLAGYVLLLQFIPFAIATPLAIFLLGATIANWKMARLVPISLIAIVMGIGIELIFTKVFTVPLP